MSNHDLSARLARLLLALTLAIIPLGIALFIPLPPSAHATGFTVNDLGDGGDAIPGNGVCETGIGNGICTLRAAIEEANTHAGADTINITATGTIVLGSWLSIFEDLDITGPGASSLTVSGNNTATVMLVNANGVVNLTGVTIANGKGSSNPGGIVVSSGSTLNLNSTEIYSNSASFYAGILNYGALNMNGGKVYSNTADSAGGGITNASGGTTNLNAVEIFSNTAASGAGGGIINQGAMYITNTNIYSNSAGSGGGISNFGALTMTTSSIRNNIGSSSAGGFYNTSGKATIDKSTIQSNSAGFFGGGVYLNSGSVTIRLSLLNHNSSSSVGGAVALYTGALLVTNTTFFTNSASTNGGAVYAGSGTITMTNATLANNAATSNSGGIRNPSGSVTLRNTIVARNTAPFSANCSGTITNGGNNIDSGTSCAWGSSNGSMSTTDPLLGPLADNGGPTLTMALLTNSPAYNGVTYNAPNGCPLRDQRGVFRPQAGLCDIGAYEVMSGTLIYLPLILK